MKKSIYLFTIILSIISLSLNAGIKVKEDHKVDIWGDLGDEGRPKAYIENPLEIFKTATTMDVYFYVNSNLKVDVYNETGTLLYTQTVNKYGGKILSVNTQSWKKGKYKIIITNVTYKKTASGQFTIE